MARSYGWTEEAYQAYLRRRKGVHAEPAPAPATPPPEHQEPPRGEILATVHLPYPPSVNKLYTVDKSGQHYLDPSQRIFRNAVASIAMIERRVTITGPIAIRIELAPPDRRRHDADNRVKSCLDALQHARIIGDDYQASTVTVVRCPPRPDAPGCTVKIWRSECSTP